MPIYAFRDANAWTVFSSGCWFWWCCGSNACNAANVTFDAGTHYCTSFCMPNKHAAAVGTPISALVLRQAAGAEGTTCRFRVRNALKWIAVQV
eukprot:6187472-Pleurochrysis_carterae.AAC.2